MHFSIAQEKAISVVQRRLKDEADANWPYLGMIPSLMVMQSIERYIEYSSEQRQRLRRAIGIRCMHVLAQDVRWRGSEFHKTFGAYVDARPWPKDLPEKKVADVKKVDTILRDSLQRHLKPLSVNKVDTGFFRYIGEFKG